MRQTSGQQPQSVPGHGTQPTQSTGNAQVADSQSQPATSESTDFLQEYSILQWLAAIVVGLITFPVGLLVPAYLLYKAQNGTGKEQSGLESWTAILFGIIGILAVEIGGRTAAKVLWGLFLVVVAVALFVVFGG